MPRATIHTDSHQVLLGPELGARKATVVEANVTPAESAPQALLTLGGSDQVYQWRPFCYMGQDRQRSETGKPPNSSAAA